MMSTDELREDLTSLDEDLHPRGDGLHVDHERLAPPTNTHLDGRVEDLVGNDVASGALRLP